MEDKLRYFEVRARGEPTRMLYALSGKPLNDERIDLETWPTVKEGLFNNVILWSVTCTRSLTLLLFHSEMEMGKLYSLYLIL